MKSVFQKSFPPLRGRALLLLGMIGLAQSMSSQIGREVAIPTHLQDGDEFEIPLPQLIDYGKRLFNAKFTIQEGAGRPMTKGTGEAGVGACSGICLVNGACTTGSPSKVNQTWHIAGYSIAQQISEYCQKVQVNGTQVQ